MIVPKFRFWLECKRYMAKNDLINWYNRTMRDLVWRLPGDVVYWSAIRLFAHATTGAHGNTSPDGLHVGDALMRWNDPTGGDVRRAHQLTRKKGGHEIYVDVAVIDEPVPDPYPECTKRSAVIEDSNKIGFFLDWLNEQDIFLAEYNEYDRIQRHIESYERLLARYFNINLDKVEIEMRAMLDEQRKHNEGAHGLH